MSAAPRRPRQTAIHLILSLTVLGLGLVKGQLIGDFFMGLKGLRGLWRWVISLWLLIPGVLIATAFRLAE